MPIFIGISAAGSDSCCVIAYLVCVVFFCQGPVSFAGSDREGVSVIYQLQGRRLFSHPAKADDSAMALIHYVDVLYHVTNLLLQFFFLFLRR